MRASTVALRRVLAMSSEDHVSGAMATTRVDAIVEFLQGAGIPYKLVEHER